MFQKAYREDMDLTFKKSKSGITFSNMDHIVGQDQDKICDMKIWISYNDIHCAFSFW